MRPAKQIQEERSFSPFFSIITVTKNDQGGLEQTLTSVVTQSFRDYEHIVVDGSPEKPALETSEQGGRIRVVQGRDRGIYDAMNKGLHRCRGRYVIFMNSGDLLAGDHVLEVVHERIMTFAEQEGATPDFVYGDSLERDGSRVTYYKKARPSSRVWYGMFTRHQAMVFSGALVRRLQYDTRWKVAGDYDFVIRFLHMASRRIYIDQPLCVFSHGGTSYLDWAEGLREVDEIRRDALGLGLPVRSLLRALQGGIALVQVNYSGLYNRLRYKKASGPSRLGRISG